MIGSKNCLLLSLGLITIAILLLIIGGSIAFTGAYMLFIASGAMYHKSIMENDIENFEAAMMNGEIASEEDGEIPENVVNLEELSESDKEVISRVFGFEFETDEEETKND
tara:strand:+ start:39781 stop:40110 length:330 start_codon:yes stop_codon:yes gene_type:complete